MNPWEPKCTFGILFSALNVNRRKKNTKPFRGEKHQRPAPASSTGLNHGYASKPNISFSTSAHCASFIIIQFPLPNIILSVIHSAEWFISIYYCWYNLIKQFPVLTGNSHFSCYAAMWVSVWLCMSVCVRCLRASGQSRVHLEQRSTHTCFQQGTPLPS